MIETGEIRLFCKAIGENDPIYFDEAMAKVRGYPAIPAPLTFLTTMTYDNPTKADLRLLNVDVGLPMANIFFIGQGPETIGRSKFGGQLRPLPFHQA